MRAKQIGGGVYDEVRHKRKLTGLANLTEVHEKRTNILTGKKRDEGSEPVTSKYIISKANKYIKRCS